MKIENRVIVEAFTLRARLLARKSAPVFSLLCLVFAASCSSAGAPSGAIKVECPYDFAAPAKVTAELHTHTTESDGTRSPSDVINAYASAGYGALAITDHNRVLWPWPVSPAGLAQVKGEEAEHMTIPADMHATFLFTEQVVRAEGESAQKAFDDVVSGGGIVFISHPYGSGLTYEDLEGLSNYVGIEIYNRFQQQWNNKGFSLNLWDRLLTEKSTRIWGFAVDDYHGGQEGLGWGKIIANANGNSAQAMKESILSGNFYSVAGTGTLRFTNITAGNGVITVLTNEPADVSFFGGGGRLLTTVLSSRIAACNLDGKEVYVRAEAISQDGTTTLFSNPISVGPKPAVAASAGGR